MAERKKCSCGCGKQSIKEGLAWACYTKKHGKQPYSYNAKKAGSREQGAGSREQGAGSREQGAVTTPKSGRVSDIVTKLKERKAMLGNEISNIDAALETIEKYA